MFDFFWKKWLRHCVCVLPVLMFFWGDKLRKIIHSVNRVLQNGNVAWCTLAAICSTNTDQPLVWKKYFRIFFALWYKCPHLSEPTELRDKSQQKQHCTSPTMPNRSLFTVWYWKTHTRLIVCHLDQKSIFFWSKATTSARWKVRRKWSILFWLLLLGEQWWHCWKGSRRIPLADVSNGTADVPVFYFLSSFLPNSQMAWSTDDPLHMISTSSFREGSTHGTYLQSVAFIAICTNVHVHLQSVVNDLLLPLHHDSLFNHACCGFPPTVNLVFFLGFSNIILHSGGILRQLHTTCMFFRIFLHYIFCPGSICS